MLAPGHDAGLLEAFAAIPGGDARQGEGRARAQPAAGDPRRPVLRPRPRRVHRRARAPGWRPTRWRCCRRSASSTRTRPGSSRCPAATDAALDVPGLGGELKPFQRAGVRYLLAQRRAFLADEQGLGKTIEALATLEADGAYPAIVVCPASLKLNWMREIERWLPGAHRADARRHDRARAVPAGRRHGRQLRHRRRPARQPRGAGAARGRARRVALLQEPGSEAHPGGPAPVRRRAARRPRPRAHRHAGHEPAGRADLPAADPRTPRGLRLGRPVRPALPRPRRLPPPALAPARALLRPAAEGRRAAAAAGRRRAPSCRSRSTTSPSTGSPSRT